MDSPVTPTAPGSKALNTLAAWLIDEREKCAPSSARWQALADVTQAMHAMQHAAGDVARETDIRIGSILSHRTNEGLVELVINGERAQMELSKAREVLGMLSGAIEAAVSDQLVFAFLTQKCGLRPETAGAALLDFRELRQGSRALVHPS